MRVTIPRAQPMENILKRLVATSLIVREHLHSTLADQG
jgi:hypothetical protein